MSGGDRALDELAALPPPAAPALSPALEAELAQLAPVPTRRPLRQLAILVGVSLVYASGLVIAVATRPDLHELPIGWLVATAVGWLFGFLAPCYLALVPPRGSLMPHWRAAAIITVVAAAGFILLGLAIHPAGPSSMRAGLHQHPCLEIGLATALAPVILGAFFLRRALPVGSRWIAAALGAGGGCLGGLVLHLHCRVVDGLHVGFIHGGIVVIAAVVSAVIVPRTSTVR